MQPLIPDNTSGERITTDTPDMEVVKILYITYKNHVVLLLKLKVKDEEIAADAYQEAFARLIKYLPYLDKRESSLSGWIYTTAWHVALHESEDRKLMQYASNVGFYRKVEDFDENAICNRLTISGLLKKMTLGYLEWPPALPLHRGPVLVDCQVLLIQTSSFRLLSI